MKQTRFTWAKIASTATAAIGIFSIYTLNFSSSALHRQGRSVASLDSHDFQDDGNHRLETIEQPEQHWESLPLAELTDILNQRSDQPSCLPDGERWGLTPQRRLRLGQPTEAADRDDSSQVTICNEHLFGQADSWFRSRLAPQRHTYCPPLPLDFPTFCSKIRDSCRRYACGSSQCWRTPHLTRNTRSVAQWAERRALSYRQSHVLRTDCCRGLPES